jgi:F420H(2)-dependent quinone reductase
MHETSPYRLPRSIPAPNLGQVFQPPPPGSRRWRVLDVLSNGNVRLYRLSGGRIGGRMGHAPVLLLHHVGRRTGTERVTPVLFLADGARLVIVGSKGGASTHPAWLANLLAQPLTTVEVGRRRVRVRARMANEEERAVYWPRLVEMYPSYATYQTRTDRVLPVVVLDPLDEP